MLLADKKYNLCESRVQAQHGWRVGTLATAGCRGQCPHCPLAFEPLIRIIYGH